MNDEQFTPRELALIEWLRQQPQIEPKPQVVENIRQQLFQEMDSLSGSEDVSQPTNITIWFIVIIIVIAALLIATVLFANSRQEQSDITPNLTDEAPMMEPIVSPTDETNSLQVTPLIEATLPAVTEVQEREGDIAHIVIEGPIQAINVTSITIFGIDIQVDPSDPILTEIRIGDTIRIEGNTMIENNALIIVSVNITIIRSTIETIPETGPSGIGGDLPPNCRRTPRGRITCRRNH